jgi:hypothetical protein
VKMSTGASETQEHLAITPVLWSLSILRPGEPALCTAKRDPVPSAVVGCGDIVIQR